MSGEVIGLKDMLDCMDKGEDFSIAFVTSDKNRGTGGEWIEVKQCRKTEYVTKEEQKLLKKAQPKVELFRNPHHYDNSTRNLQLPNGEIRKVAIRLIRRFNGMTVM